MNTTLHLSLTVVTIFTLIFIGCQDDPKAPSVLDLQVEDFVESPYVWGYIDTQGEVEIPPRFDDVRDFREDLAPAMKEGMWGYINKSGNWEIQPQYAEAHGFYNGKAKVRCGDGLFGIIDKKGAFIIACEWQFIDDPKGSFFKAQREGKIDLLNARGESILGTAIEASTSVINDRAVVRRGQQYFVAQKEGIETGPWSQVYLSDAHQITFKQNDQWGYMDSKGNVLIDPSFNEAQPFLDERAVVYREDQYYWINQNGKVLFSSSEELENIGEKCCLKYLDEESACLVLGDNGEVLIPDTLAEVHAFSNTWAPFRKDSTWNYFNPQGKVLSETSGELAWPFHEGYARIITGDGIGFLDTSGSLVIPPKFFEVKDFHEGLARFQGFR